MTRLAPLLLIALFPAALFAEDKKEEKKDDPKSVVFASKDGKFTVTVPAKPTEKTNKVKIGAGEVEVHLFTVDQKDRAYIVSYTDYPPGRLDPDAEKVLAGVIDGNAKSLKGKVVADEKITIGKKKYPGHEIKIEFGGEKKSLYRARVYLVGARLYQVVALGPDEFAKSKAVDDYLKSFVLEE